MLGIVRYAAELEFDNMNQSDALERLEVLIGIGEAVLKTR